MIDDVRNHNCGTKLRCDYGIRMINDYIIICNNNYNHVMLFNIIFIAIDHIFHSLIFKCLNITQNCIAS